MSGNETTPDKLKRTQSFTQVDPKLKTGSNNCHVSKVLEQREKTKQKDEKNGFKR